MPDKVRRQPVSEGVARSLAALAELRQALVDGKPLAAALTHCDNLAEELYCLESRTGCITPPALFDQ